MQQNTTIPEYAGVILITPRQQIILQLRDDRPDIIDPNSLSIFAGQLEPGETPEQGARREVFEETTLQPDTLEFFMTYLPDIGRYGRNIKRHIFIARDIDPATVHVREGQGYRLISSSLDLERYEFSLISKEILRAFFDGEGEKPRENTATDSV